MTAQKGKVMEIVIRMILILITFELIFFIVPFILSLDHPIQADYFSKMVSLYRKRVPTFLSWTCPLLSARIKVTESVSYFQVQSCPKCSEQQQLRVIFLSIGNLRISIFG
jgi:hypothetical protein